MVTFGRNSENFARVLNTTTAEYVRNEMNNILRERVLFSKLKSFGKIVKQPGGDSRVWPVRHKQQTLNTMADQPAITFQRINRHVNATLPPRGYWVADQMTLWEHYQNQGKQAIINIHADIVKNLMLDFKDEYGDEFYKDGNIAGAQGIHGLESFFSTSAAHTNTKVGAPDDSYAGISTALGVKGLWNNNTATVAWPDGTGRPGYHYWSPLVLNDNGIDFGAATDDWANSCLRILKYATLSQLKRRSKLDCWILSTEAYRVVSDLIEERERVFVKRKEGDIGDIELGFGPHLYYENVMVSSEYGVPETGTDTRGAHTIRGYGLNIKDGIELRHWTPSLIHALKVDFSVESLSRRYAVISMANMFCNPQKHVKLGSW